MTGSVVDIRRRWLTRPLLGRLRGALPGACRTEREALEAGDVWRDAALFSGDPDWNALLATPPARLPEREQAFVDGPVETLCRMADDWQIIADEPGTVDNGLLTPTMKVRRGQVLERYGETIERLYEEHAARAGA